MEEMSKFKFTAHPLSKKLFENNKTIKNDSIKKRKEKMNQIIKNVKILDKNSQNIKKTNPIKKDEEKRIKISKSNFKDKIKKPNLLSTFIKKNSNRELTVPKSPKLQTKIRSIRK